MSQPWEIQPDESQAAYNAFLAYLHLGYKRSVLVAYKKATGKEDTKCAPGFWKEWCTCHCWVARARAYDEYWYAEQLKMAAQTRRTALGKILANVPDLADRLITAALAGDAKATRACLDALGVAGIAASKEPVQLSEAVTAPDAPKPADWAGADKADQDEQLAKTIWG